MRRFAAIGLVLAVTSCVHARGDREAKQRRAERAAKLDSISSQDGIQLEEARILANTYFTSFIAGCGFADDPVLTAGTWRSVPRVGYAGDRLTKSIDIDSKT